MKFTDGYWLHRPGITALNPRDVSDVVAEGSKLSVFAPTQPIKSRGDALNCPQLTITFESPLPDVISVTIEHFQGPWIRDRTLRSRMPTRTSTSPSVTDRLSMPPAR